jgi:hypothetical protein
MMSLRSLPALLLLAAAPAAFAQTPPIDEGTLVIARSGVSMGTETFRVVRMPGDASGLIRITAQRVFGEHRIASSLTADSLGTPRTYDLTARDGKVKLMSLQARSAPGRLSVLSSDQKGNESMKEFVVAPGGTLILDEDLFHQYFLIALNRRSGSLKVIVPQTGHEMSASLVPGGMESIEIGGRNVTATKYSLGGGREFWVDSSGRLLRVSLPGGVTATREELAR